MFYVQVLGSYDCTTIGPFPTMTSAEIFKQSVPKQFDSFVLTQIELDKNFDEFGKTEIEKPRISFDSGDFVFTDNI